LVYQTTVIRQKVLQAMSKVQTAVSAFHDWLDNRAVIRRLVLLFTLYMTWYGVHTAWLFAKVSTFDGLGTAAVIAAVLAPVAALQGFAFNSYTKSRGE